MRKDILFLSIVALCTGCASTTMTKNWVYPEHGPLDFNHIMAVVLVQDPLVRQRGEEELVRQIRKADAVASYTLMPSQQLDENEFKKAVGDSGVDAVIIMRPVSDQQELRYVPGSYPAAYGTYWGYYGWAYPVVYSPGYHTNDRIVAVETTVDARPQELAVAGVVEPEGRGETRR